MTVATPLRPRATESSTGKDLDPSPLGTSTVTSPPSPPEPSRHHGAGTTQIHDETRAHTRTVTATEIDASAPSEPGGAPPRSSVLSAALAGVHAVLAAEPDIELWQATARRLRAATEQERRRSRRHAAVALLLADVLSYTAPADLPDPRAAQSALSLGSRALSEPFISTETERRVTEELAKAGWQLVLPYRGWAAAI
jgi:hypothetical protein